MVKDYTHFLKIIKGLKLYIVKYEEDRTIKVKVYLANYIIKSQNQQPIIINDL